MRCISKRACVKLLAALIIVLNYQVLTWWYAESKHVSVTITQRPTIHVSTFRQYQWVPPASANERISNPVKTHPATLMITQQQMPHVEGSSTVHPYQLPTHGSQYNWSSSGTFRGSKELTRSAPPHVRYVADSANETSEIKSLLDKQEEACVVWRREGQCPCLPPSLKGKMELNVNITLTYTWEDVSVFAGADELGLGGTWEPKDCQALRRLLIIVPCRDRESHLRAFLAHMHPVLQRQQLAYRILVVEQRLPILFNKAATMNAGFAEAISHKWAFDCVVLHDVDLLVEDDRNLLTCGHNVMHYGMFIDKFAYKKNRALLFGGIVAMTREQFIAINGYTNQFFGWGGEDDNAFKRVSSRQLDISRPSVSVGKYSSIRHPPDNANPKVRRAGSVLWNATYEEGLSTVSYDVVSILMQPTFTHVILDLNTTNLPYPWTNSRKTATYFTKVPNTTCSNTDVVGTLNNTGDNFLNRCMDLCSANMRCSAFTVEHAVGSTCRMRASHCMEQGSQTPGTTMHLKAVDLDLKELRSSYSVYTSDCFGNDLETRQRASTYKCALRCEALRSCGGFVISNGKCYVKSSCMPGIVIYKAEVLRSYVRQYTRSSDIV